MVQILQLTAISLSIIIITCALIMKRPNGKFLARKLLKERGSIIRGYVEKSDTSGYETSGSVENLAYTLDFRRDLDYAILKVRLPAPTDTRVLFVPSNSPLLNSPQPVENIAAAFPAKTAAETGTLYSNVAAEQYLDVNQQLANAHAWEITKDDLYIFVSAEKDIFKYSPSGAPADTRHDAAVQRFAPFIAAITQLLNAPTHRP